MFFKRAKAVIIVSFLCIATIFTFFYIELVKASVPEEEWFNRQTIASTSDSGYLNNNVRVPCIGTFANGSMWVVFEGRDGNDFGETNLIKTMSFDNGSTWTDAETWYSCISEVEGCNDAVTFTNPGFIRYGNRMYFTFSVRPTTCSDHTDETYSFIQYSDDNGSSWSSVLNLSSKCSSYSTYGYNLVEPGSVITNNGTIIIPVWGSHYPGDVMFGFSYYCYAGDDDPTDINKWHTGGSYGTSVEVNEPTFCILDNESIFVMSRTEGVNPMYAWSEDNSVSWTSMHNWISDEAECKSDVATFSSNYTYDGYSAGQPILHDKNRILYSFCQDSRPGNIDVYLSYDNAQSWSEEKTVSDGEKGVYSDIGVADNGTIVIVYETGGYEKINVAQFNLEWLTDSNDWVNETQTSSFCFQSINNQKNNTVTNDVITDFNWTKDDDAVYYQLQIANDSGFTDVFVDINVNSTLFSGNYTETGDYVEFVLPDSYRKDWYQSYFFRIRPVSWYDGG